jgi:hypothetical protein
MKRRSKLHCRPDGQRLQILNAYNHDELGYIEFPRGQGYTVRTPLGELVAVVRSIEEAFVALGYANEHHLSVAD